MTSETFVFNTEIFAVITFDDGDEDDDDDDDDSDDVLF